MKNIIVLFMLVLTPLVSMANDHKASTAASLFQYEEMEEGVGISQIRYLFTTRYLRIDYGNDDDDFILYDQDASSIYSVNHADQTILFIKAREWKMPEWKFKRQVLIKDLPDAPRIAGHQLKNYQLKADEKVCVDVQLIPGIYKKEMAMMKAYQNVLSGQQTSMLANTPVEMRTPCFLADQVHNDGNYYALGLPVQEWHSYGYGKFLKNYKEITVPENLFELPGTYRHYSAMSPDN